MNRKKNGELYYVEESICPIRDADGKITHFISNGRDLTERLRLEAQLLQAQKWTRSDAWLEALHTTSTIC